MAPVEAVRRVVLDHQVAHRKNFQSIVDRRPGQLEQAAQTLDDLWIRLLASDEQQGEAGPAAPAADHR